ncbi:hypothetical protein IMSAGC013_02669 [Lachnospiraceae bacterium]|nr:hypothetical protein IMSAGC013_02669 [Lachnospiraceae bacterium]
MKGIDCRNKEAMQNREKGIDCRNKETMQSKSKIIIRE